MWLYHGSETQVLNGNVQVLGCVRLHKLTKECNIYITRWRFPMGLASAFSTSKQASTCTFSKRDKGLDGASFPYIVWETSKTQGICRTTVFRVCACLSQAIADSAGMALHAAKSERALSLHSFDAFDCFLRFVSLKIKRFWPFPCIPCLERQPQAEMPPRSWRPRDLFKYVSGEPGC